MSECVGFSCPDAVSSPIQTMLLLLLHYLAASIGAPCPARAAFIPELTTGFQTYGALFSDFQAECCGSGRTINWTVTTAAFSPDDNPFQGSLPTSVARVAASCSSGEEISTPLFGYNGAQNCQNNNTASSQVSQPEDNGAFYFEVYRDFQLINFMGVSSSCIDLTLFSDCLNPRGIISCPSGTSPIGVGARSSCFSILALQVVCADTNTTRNDRGGGGNALCSAYTAPAWVGNTEKDSIAPSPLVPRSDIPRNPPILSPMSSSGTNLIDITQADCCPAGEGIAKWTVAVAPTKVVLPGGVERGTTSVVLIQGFCTDGSLLGPLQLNGTESALCDQQEQASNVFRYSTPKSQRFYSSFLDTGTGTNLLVSFMESSSLENTDSTRQVYNACPPGKAAAGYSSRISSTGNSCQYISNISILCGDLSESARAMLEKYSSVQDNPPTDAEAGGCPGGTSMLPRFINITSRGVLASSLSHSCCPSGKTISAFNVWPSGNSPPLVGQVSAVCSDSNGRHPANTSTIAYGFNGTFLNGTASFCPNTTREMRSLPLENEAWNFRLTTQFESLMEWPTANATASVGTGQSILKSTLQCSDGQPLGFFARSSCLELTDFTVICGEVRPSSSSAENTDAAAAESGQSSGSNRTTGVAVGVSVAAAFVALLAGVAIYKRHRGNKRKTSIDSRQLFNLNAPAGFVKGVTMTGAELDRRQSGRITSLDRSGFPRSLADIADGLMTIEGIGCSDDDTPVSFDGIPAEWEIKPKQLKVYCVDGKPIELGRGGFGVVLYGTVHKEDAAIKMIKERSQEAELLKEIAILARAKTQYVVRFLGYCVCPDGLLLAMEYMQGGTLWQKLRTSNDFQWSKRGQQAFKEICKGMYMLHSNRIAHLDMKSPNILIADDGQCKISDLGLGRLLKPDAQDTTGEGMGSYAWMAPEQMNGRCGFSSDIWALSTILWEICTLKSPIGVPREDIPGDMKAPKDLPAIPQAVLDLARICRLENPLDRPLISKICDLLDCWDGHSTVQSLHPSNFAPYVPYDSSALATQQGHPSHAQQSSCTD